MIMNNIFNKNLEHLNQETIETLLAYIDPNGEGLQARERLLAALNENVSDLYKLPHNKHESLSVDSHEEATLETKRPMSSPGIFGRLARSVFDISNPISHRKQHGQFFTPPTICALACAAAIHSIESSVIDPMCGTGTMLWSALERLTFLGNFSSANITGVEIDPLAAKIAVLPLDEHHTQNTQNLKVLCADSFLELSNLLPQRETNGHNGHYDAIIGNPPYVRYQNFASMFQDTYPEVVHAFQKELPKETKSAVAVTIIRASLIAHLLSTVDGDLQDIAHEAVTMLRSRTSSTPLNPVDACWLKLVANYSGLADLSLPAWLLTWRLARPGAIIAYVTTSSWKNREYARFLRYFMYRMLQPLFFIEQEGSWFNDALIPTSLMIFRARSAEEVAIPLRERVGRTDSVRIVRVRHEFNLAVHADLQKAAFSLEPDNVNGIDTGIATYADILIRAIEKQEKDVKNDLWTIDLVPEQSLVDELFNEDIAVQRSSTNSINLQDLENPQADKRQLSKVKTTFSTDKTAIPRSLQQALGSSTLPLDAFKLLTDYKVEVNQGLRTGCNSFFYVRQLTEVDWNRWLPNEFPEEVITTLEHPAEHAAHFLRVIMQLDKINAYIPEEAPSACPSSSLVKLDKEFGERLAIFPNAMLKPVVRYQKNITRWAIDDSSLLPDRALVIKAAATADDYVGLSSYPAHWIEVWKEQYNLSVLPSGLTKYILEAAKTKLERNNHFVLIPKLSAVAPNVRLPSQPTHHQLFVDEGIPPNVPSWWYTLPILPRHIGAIFMPRVNDDSPCAYLNFAYNPVLIDANFSTFSTNKNLLSSEALFALLNSTWTKSLLEATANVMGGGALKVEAAHLRILTIPNMDGESIIRLEKLGKQLALLSKLQGDALDILQEIDKAVADQIAVTARLETSHVLMVLNTFSKELRQRRKR